MEKKTKIIAEPNKQELFIEREFDLTVDLLFKAFIEPEIVEQWMGTKVHKLDAVKYGAFRFVTTDPMGNEHGFNGVFHDVILNEKIIRTFEMENTPFTTQLEYLEFESLGEKSTLKMHLLFKSVEMRDQLLKMPFEFGINMAHDRLQEIMSSKIS